MNSTVVVPQGIIEKTAKPMLNGLLPSEDLKACLQENGSIEECIKQFLGDKIDEILVDWYAMCVGYAVESLKFDVKQINIQERTCKQEEKGRGSVHNLSSLLAIIHELHEFSTSTSYANQMQAYNYMRELLLVHSVNQSPWKVIVFQPFDIGNLANFIVDNYFRHYSVYKYCFTPKVDLDIMLKEQTDENMEEEKSVGKIEFDSDAEFEVLMRKCAEMQLEMEKVVIQRKLKRDLESVQSAVDAKIKEFTTPVKGKK